METLTKEQGIDFAESFAWKSWSDEQIVEFQLFQPWVCMDFKRFRYALESVLERRVPKCEFRFPDLLRKEYLNKKAEQLVNMSN
jgi:hypothetical protein